MESNKLGFWIFTIVACLIIGVFFVFGEKQTVKPVSLLPPIEPEKSPSKRVEPPALKFRNTDLNVSYVGDENCQNCHFQETESFREHPMGRSMCKIGDAKLKPFDKPFVVGEYRYSVESRDNKMFHVEERLDRNGKPVSRRDQAIDLVMGSGTRGFAFLFQKEGDVFQSPIAWYTDADKYDIAPGYTEVNLHFTREIQQDCFYCHTNRVEKVADNQIKFHGLAIGCERCHGAGELHAEKQDQIDGYDQTIVNPVKLTPSRRDQVCYQCHLHVEARENRLHTSIDKYRPGLDLENYIRRKSENSPDPLAQFRSVSHVQQMESSACYVKSEGKLGCVSCHNPHGWVAPAQRQEYYRKKCQECHKPENDCALPSETRLAKSPENDCMTCHMPKQQSGDIAHTALTDHSIKRISKEYQEMINPKPKDAAKGN